MNVTTLTSYTPDGNIATLTAKNPVTGDQTTRYLYGTTLGSGGAGESAIARSDLLVAILYPDAADSADSIRFAYNRQSQVNWIQDQNGNVHEYDFDGLARRLSDVIALLGAGVDGAVRRIDTAYDIRGMIDLITSRAGTAADSTMVNQVLRQFNNFAQLQKEYQQHDGPVNTLASPYVEYGYADGSANTIRPTSIAPPFSDFYATEFDYAGDDDALIRPTDVAVSWPGSTSRLRLFRRGERGGDNYGPTSGSPVIGCTLASGSLYPCFDQFGRLIEVPWTKLGDSTNIVDLKYGYNPRTAALIAATRLRTMRARKNRSTSIYSYDGIQRLVNAARGLLSSAPSPLTGEGRGEGAAPRLDTATFGQGWKLDATGNWSSFNQFDPVRRVLRTRSACTSNVANEITAIAGTVGAQWATPVYDRNGNMTSVPQPADMTAVYQGIWDAWNRLVGLYDGATLVQGNSYDGLNRRTNIILPDETRDDYYTADWRLIQEDSTLPATTIFYWGLRYIDELIARFDLRSSAFIYSLPDANWNVVAIADTSASVLDATPTPPTA